MIENISKSNYLLKKVNQTNLIVFIDVICKTLVISLNCDGSSFGNPPCGAIGVVFRNSSSDFLGAYAQNIGNATALEVEFSACMFAFEWAKRLKLDKIWLETDSLAVIKAFTNHEGVPWKMVVRWQNCLIFSSSIRCICTHVLREGNLDADAMAKHGQNLAMFAAQWWNTAPLFVTPFLYRDSLALPYMRIDIN